MPIAKWEHETLRPYSRESVTSRRSPSFLSRVAVSRSCLGDSHLHPDSHLQGGQPGSTAPARPATGDRSATGECGSAPLRQCGLRERPSATGDRRSEPRPPLRERYRSRLCALRPCGLRERPSATADRSHFCISGLYYFRAARLKHSKFSEIRVRPWAEGSARGPARHGPNLILGRAGPKLNVSGLFGLGPGRAGRPECTPILISNGQYYLNQPHLSSLSTTVPPLASSISHDPATSSPSASLVLLSPLTPYFLFSHRNRRVSTGYMLVDPKKVTHSLYGSMSYITISRYYTISYIDVTIVLKY
jgi:hypothetical protein